MHAVTAGRRTFHGDVRRSGAPGEKARHHDPDHPDNTPRGSLWYPVAVAALPDQGTSSISTRRLMAMFSREVFGTLGFFSPKATAVNLDRSMP